jgi:hypothetical protein
VADQQLKMVSTHGTMVTPPREVSGRVVQRTSYPVTGGERHDLSPVFRTFLIGLSPAEPNPSRIRFDDLFRKYAERGLDESSLPGDRPPDDEGVHLAGALVRIDSFGIREVADHVVVEHDAVSAE